MNMEMNQVDLQKVSIKSEDRERELIDNSLRLMAIVCQRLQESVELIHMNKDKFDNTLIDKEVTVEEIANASEGLEIISEGLENLIRMFTRTKGMQK